MKAVAVFPKRKEVKLIHQEEPELAAPSQVKVRMLEVGICGTDREICSFQYGTPKMINGVLNINGKPVKRDGGGPTQ